MMYYLYTVIQQSRTFHPCTVPDVKSQKENLNDSFSVRRQTCNADLDRTHLSAST